MGRLQRLRTGRAWTGRTSCRPAAVTDCVASMDPARGQRLGVAFGPGRRSRAPAFESESAWQDIHYANPGPRTETPILTVARVSET